MEPYKLLFVDDEGDFLDTIKEFFEDMGYVVHTALNGEEALLRVKEHRPNAVFLDISMPQMDGTETLRLIHEIDTGIQVIVVPRHASEDLARDLLKHGACDFFQKPVDLERLHETIERLRSQARRGSGLGAEAAGRRRAQLLHRPRPPRAAGRRASRSRFCPPDACRWRLIPRGSVRAIAVARICRRRLSHSPGSKTQVVSTSSIPQ